MNARPQPKPYDPRNDIAEASYPLEELIGFIAGGEILDSLRGVRAASAAAPVTNTAVEDAANAVREYIGKDAKMIINKDGDMILMNDTSKLRFDVKDPHGYEPHFHVQRLNEEGRWVDAGEQHMYFFKDR